MPMQVRCPKCKTVIKVSGKLAGKKAKCPKCSQVLQLPSAKGKSATGGAAKKAAPPAPPPADSLAPPMQDSAGYGLADEAADEQAESSEPSTCPKCNRTLEPGAVVCVECGINVKTGKELKTDVGEELAEAPERVRRQRPSTLQNLMALLPGRKVMIQTVVVLVVVGVAFYYLGWPHVRPYILKSSGSSGSGNVLAEADTLAGEGKHWEAYQKVAAAWIECYQAGKSESDESGGPSRDDLEKKLRDLRPKVEADLTKASETVADGTNTFISSAGIFQGLAGEFSEQCGDTASDEAKKTAGEEVSKLSDEDKKTLYEDDLPKAARKLVNSLEDLKEEWPDVDEAYSDFTSGLDEAQKACGPVRELIVWHHYAKQALEEAAKKWPDYTVIAALLTKASPHFKAARGDEAQRF